MGQIFRGDVSRKHHSFRKNAMNFTLLILLFASVGLALLVINIHYISSVWNRFISPSFSHHLRPFEIIGLDAEQTERLRIALPRMVIARLHSIKEESNSAISYLTDARALSQAKGPLFPSDPRFVELPIPTRFTRPVEIDLEVADIELGWLVSWFFEASRAYEFLDITIYYSNSGEQNSKGKVHIYGHAAGRHGYSFSLSTVDNLEIMVREIAATIIQLSIRRHDPALEMLDASDFSETMATLSQFARLERNHLLATPSPESYRNVFVKLKELGERLPKWKDLQLIAAVVSERAREWKQARIHYQNALDGTPKFDPYYRILETKVATIDEELQAAEKAAVAASAGPPSVRSDQVALARKESREAASVLVGSQFTAPILDVMGISDNGSGENVRIAVVGGAPWEESIGTASVEFIGGPDGAYFGSDGLRNYQTEILQTVRMIAPRSTFLYAPIIREVGDHGILGEDFLAALKLYGSSSGARPNIILLTLGGVVESPEINKAIRAVPEDVIVIVASGNVIRSGEQDRTESIYDDVTKDALVVASANIDGVPSSFSPESKNMVWAPGEGVPVISPASGKTVLRSGSAFSAALVAGAVSRLVSATQDGNNAERIRRTLREMATKTVGNEQKALVNVDEALVALNTES